MTGTRVHIAALLLSYSVAACGAENDTPGEVTGGCSDTNWTPVLFVHGSGLSADSWGDALGAFQRAGYPQAALLAVDLDPADGDNIAAAAEQLPVAVDILLQQSNAHAASSACPTTPLLKVDIVAHSMGALSSRWYAAKIAPERVRTLITIAGANHGTNAICGYSGTGNKQMCPAYARRTGPSEVQYQLNGVPGALADETPFGVGPDGMDRPRVAPDDDRSIVYLTVRLDPDEWIVPSESAILDGTGGMPAAELQGHPVTVTTPGNLLLTKAVSHDDLPYDPDLIRLLIDALAGIAP